MFSDILVIPTPPQPRRVEKMKCALVLTSAESRAFLEEKEKKMKQQQEERERRKEGEEKCKGAGKTAQSTGKGSEEG